ncbi:GNAT family N-acetyltransferase [Phycisphaera mikurensis]|uniref:Putative acetyltransferase n=1 Tax=Phycisphaera mikurensis (strain NBRC 102666 / KCTC 22515 / FYK2301M01) TaxID=1142394 RepID=I0IGK1_PHYMF|nr:GNAT superfamily N-acetyltransferase [Phycisphaera mikurensis]BAM04389.1 putative acetyltransferase [Phycisphaera mikurensis NBRC 102666]
MIRDARPGDLDAIFGFIHALAAYERESESVAFDPHEFGENLFGPEPCAEVLLAEEAGRPVGFALFYRSFSTWTGKPGLHLEDLFVSPAARGRGHGRALIAAVARKAVQRGCARLEWAVLDWNRPAIDFYETLRSVPQSGWTTHRLDGEALAGLARGPRPPDG